MLKSLTNHHAFYLKSIFDIIKTEEIHLIRYEKIKIFYSE